MCNDIFQISENNKKIQAVLILESNYHPLNTKGNQGLHRIKVFIKIFLFSTTKSKKILIDNVIFKLSRFLF